MKGRKQEEKREIWTEREDERRGEEKGGKGGSRSI